MLVLDLEVEEDPVESVETSLAGPSPSDIIRSPWRKHSLKVRMIIRGSHHSHDHAEVYIRKKLHKLENLKASLATESVS